MHSGNVKKCLTQELVAGLIKIRMKGSIMRSVCIISALLIILTGCDQANLIKKMTPPEAESAAKGYIELLRQNQFEEIEKHLDPSIASQNTREMLTKMAQLIPHQMPDSIKVVGSHVIKTPESLNTNITFEYQFQSNWMLINVATQKKGDSTTVVGFNVNPIPDSLEQLNKFTLSRKSPLHYSLFFMAIIIPLFILYSLVLCIRTKIDKRKWLWIIFIILGFAKFSIDWTTGQWGIAPIYVSLFGASALAPPYGSFVISVSLPLGAIIFMLNRKRFLKQQIEKENREELANSCPEKENWLN